MLFYDWFIHKYEKSKSWKEEEKFNIIKYNRKCALNMLFHNQKVFLFFRYISPRFHVIIPFYGTVLLTWLPYTLCFFLIFCVILQKKKFSTYEMSLNIAWTLVKLFLTSSKKKKFYVEGECMRYRIMDQNTCWYAAMKKGRRNIVK